MLQLKHIHHIAIICSNYEKSKQFYTETLGLEIIREVYREERKSYKLDVAVSGNYCIVLFTFPNPPVRTSTPEAQGLRHLAFAVENLDQTVTFLNSKNIYVEPIRIDEFT